MVMADNKCVNWSEDEKCLLVESMKTKSTTIESKKVDSRIDKKKQAGWKEIEAEFVVNGKNRNLKPIKEQWRRMKREAKQRISKYEKYRLKTGGGECKTEKPHDLDYFIKDMLPHEFEEDKNNFDSQAAADSEKDYEIEVADIYRINPITGELEIENIQEKNNDLEITNKKLPAKKGEHGRKRKSEELTSFEAASLQIMEKKAMQEMEQSKELHQLRIKWEEKIYKIKYQTLKQKMGSSSEVISNRGDSD